MVLSCAAKFEYEHDILLVAARTSGIASVTFSLTFSKK